MYLNKPNGNASSISVNDLQPPPTPHTPRTPHTPLPGIRSHIGHLLPRHTYFRARVTIHQVSSVPFVSGQFGVRWKFKGVQSTPAGHKPGLLVRVKARVDKGKGREDVVLMASDSPQALPSPLPVTEDGHIVVRQNVGGGARSVSGPSTEFSIGSSHKSSVSSHSSVVGHSQHLSADWGTTITSSSSSPSKLNTTSISKTSSAITIAATPSTTTISDFPAVLNSPNPSATLARGMTPFIKLKDHCVIWQQTLDTIIKFDVDRETSMIHPNPLKLVVMQRVIPDDPQNSPQNPRLGAVYLNLAEYVGQGVVERRYLLKECKTNATLKLSIEMTYVSGETTYIPPPLAKGEILTGIAGFLENDTVKKRPRALDIYGPYQDQEDLEIDLLGIKSTAVPRTARSTRRPSDKSALLPPEAGGESESEGGEDGDRSMEADADEEAEEGEEDVAFDVQRLPFAYGTKTTELLIDALFNPVKTSERREENPFTIYVPPSPPASRDRSGGRAGIGLGLSGVVVDRAGGASVLSARGGGGSVHPRRQQSTSSSVYTTTSTSSTGSRAETSESARSRHQRDDGASAAAARVQFDVSHEHRRKGSTGTHSTSASTSASASGVVVVGGPAHVKSTPEGRIVVGPVQEEQIGVVRAWWRKRVRPSPLPSSTTAMPALKI